jgi:hypothetical protein
VTENRKFKTDEPKSYASAPFASFPFLISCFLLSIFFSHPGHCTAAVRSRILARMGRPTGSADLPLHGGRVPQWLAARMARLGRVITEAIVQHYGREEFLRRLAHPFWFQAFGAVMGMDWHSSGITTSVMGALKRGLAPVEHELGLHVCGGRGRHSRQTPAELVTIGERVGVDGEALARTSRLVAKVDSAAVQDGFDLYLHSFVVTDDGAWTIVQQGMSPTRRQARRYHWLSEGLRSFVDEPHNAIAGPNQGQIVNLTDHRAAASRLAQVELGHGDPAHVVALLRQLRECDSNPHLQMPMHHDVRPSDVFLRRLHGTLAAVADRGPKDFAELLLVPGVGARTVLALAMVSEVVHGAPCRFADPARFALAHGGKDGHPFPVPLKVYDETIDVLRTAVARAKLGREDKLAAIRRLDAHARALERTAGGPTFGELVAQETARSPDYGGWTVAGPAKRRHDDAPPKMKPRQLALL